MDKLQTVENEAKDILSKFLTTFEVEVTEADGMVSVMVKTDEEAPTAIGRHGETIRAVQKILEVILFKKLGEPVDILVNVNDYREKQTERLEHIAAEHCDRVRQYNKPSYMRGLSSYERRIVHTYITSQYPDLTTYSVGEGRDRRLVISLKDENNQNESTTQQSSDFSTDDIN